MADEKYRQEAEEIVEKLKDAVKKGNIARIYLKKGENTVLNLPLNAGIAGTILGLAVAPWALITSALVTLGLDCSIVMVKTSGEEVELLSREVGRKAVAVGSELVGEVKTRIHRSAEPEDADVCEIPVEDDPETKETEE